MPFLKRQPQKPQAPKIGIRSHLYIAPLSIFSDLKEPTPGTGIGVNATISGTHTFTTPTSGTNGFIEIGLVGMENGKFNVKTGGNQPSKTIESSFESNTVGLTAEQIEMIEALFGVDCIVLLKAANCDNPIVYQLGCKCDPVAGIDFDFTTDSNVLKLMGKSDCFPRVYTGAITLQS